MNRFFNNWLYEKTENNTARFVLGEEGNNPLICIGVNPSTAEPDNLDPTLTQVKLRAARMGYDGWIMLNLYPQRATNPNNLHQEIDIGYSTLNNFYIGEIAKKYKQLDIWAAWGSLIEKREYLYPCLKAIFEILGTFCKNIKWINIGSLTKAGHPHHPLYLAKDADITEFNISKYLKETLKCGNGTIPGILSTQLKS